jgi:hypothetical protein
MSAGARAATVFAVGGGLLFFVEETVATIAGVLLMLGGVVLAVFAIATDEFLRGDRD